MKYPLLSFLAVFAAPGMTKAQINWLSYDFPPAFIQSGPLKGNGEIDLLYKYFRAQLPGYKHITTPVNIRRMLHMLKSKNNVCTSSVIKNPEREKTMYFSSLPSSVISSVGLVSRREDTGRFKKEVSLHTIMEDPSATGVLSAGRRYGDVADKIIENHQTNPNLFFRSSEDITKGLLEMVSKGRADYTLAYEWELKYNLVKGHMVLDNLVFHPIKEIPPYMVTYTACSRSPLGKKMITKINAALESIVGTPQHRMFSERWMLDQKRYRNAYEQTYLEYVTNSKNQG